MVTGASKKCNWPALHMQISLIHCFSLNIPSTCSLIFWYICLQTRRLLKVLKAWGGCISYFSPGVMKHYDLRNLPKEESIWVYGSRGMSPPQQRDTAAGRHGAEGEAERSYTLPHPIPCHGVNSIASSLCFQITSSGSFDILSMERDKLSPCMKLI